MLLTGQAEQVPRTPGVLGIILRGPDVVHSRGMPYHVNVLSAITADIVYQMRDEYIPRIQTSTTKIFFSYLKAANCCPIYLFIAAPFFLSVVLYLIISQHPLQ